MATTRGDGHRLGSSGEAQDHREPWPRHGGASLGLNDAIFSDPELTIARESPAIRLDLGGAEGKSLAGALVAIDALLEV